MSRIDPAHYPDRFAFEAYARKLQSEEIRRQSASALRWIDAHGVAALRAGAQALAHRGLQRVRGLAH